VFDDLASSALRVALSGLSLRQKVIANNIANIETPGFHAGKVKFEDALHTALYNGDPIAGMQATQGKSLEPTRMDGNNVNLDEETLSNVDTELRYQLALNAMDSKYSLLHDVIKG
jgi:flagellar basal-body rod protein FlgB